MSETYYTIENIYEKSDLRVVGWTNFDNDVFQNAKLNDETIFVVARAVKDGGYLFGGDSHQEEYGCAPVLNNGTCARFSWRGWGLVIAIAYNIRGNNGNYDHLCGYMNQMIKPQYIKTPSGGVDYSAIHFAKPTKTVTLPLPASQDFYAVRSYFAVESDSLADTIEVYDNVVLFSPVVDYAREKYFVERVIRAESFEKALELLEEQRSYVAYEFFGYECDGEYDREAILKKLHADYPNCKGATLLQIDLIDIENVE